MPAFMHYCGGWIRKMQLNADGSVSFENLEPHGDWAFNDTGEINELVIKFHQKAEAAKVKEHKYSLIGPNVFELRTRDGYDIPNRFHQARNLLIAMPENWESEGSADKVQDEHASDKENQMPKASSEAPDA